MASRMARESLSRSVSIDVSPLAILQRRKGTLLHGLDSYGKQMSDPRLIFR